MDTHLPQDFHEIARKTAIAAAKPRTYGWGWKVPLGCAILIAGIAIGGVATHPPYGRTPVVEDKPLQSGAIYNAPCRQPQVGEKRIITTIPYADGRVDTSCSIHRIDNRWPAVVKQG